MKGYTVKRRNTVAAGFAAVCLAVTMMGSGVAHAGDRSTKNLPAGSYTTSGASESEVTALPPNSKLGKMQKRLAAAKAAATATVDPNELGDHVSSDADLKVFNPKTGKVIFRKHLPQSTMGKKLHAFPKQPLAGHGTGGDSTASGCAKVTINQKLHSVIGRVIAEWHIDTKWCWLRAPQTTDVNDTGVTQDHDQAWTYDGVLHEFDENHYYDFSVNDGHPKSAYMFVRVASFHGPALGASINAQWTPKNSLATYYNGTYQWWTSD